MKTICKVTLLGAVGRDPEVRFTPAGMAIANFSLATEKKSKESSMTMWHNCVAFGKLAEIVQQFVFKGTKLYADGTIEYQEYDKDGETRKAVKIILNEISILFTPDDSNKLKSSFQKPIELSQRQSSLPDDGIPF